MKSRRIAGPLFVVALATAAPGCFALFSLDDFGPPGPAVDASVPDTAPPVVDSAVPSDGNDGRATKRVFITATEKAPTFGGVAGADKVCQESAVGAKLSGTFKAWISDDGETPRTRFAAPDGGAADVRLVDMAGTTVATSYATLLAGGTLLAPIDRTETGAKAQVVDAKTSDQIAARCALDGQAATVIAAWTNTNPDGSKNDQQLDCVNFTGTSGTTRVGFVGTAPTWTSACDLPCSLMARLYCFEQ